MNFYISDLHLFHEASIRFDQRPFSSLEEMHEMILENWNKWITNGDTVYILGDISLRGRNEDLIAFVAKLKGKKVLVKGNHDDLSDYRYQQLFHEIVDYKEIRDAFDGKNYKLVLCHYPLFSWKDMGKGSILLYGHTHNSQEDVYFQNCLKEMHEKECRHASNEVKAYNVGCIKSYMGYIPRTLKEILESNEGGM